MKRILIVVAILIAVLLGVLMVGAFSINSVLDRYKPELEKVASSAIGEKVQIEDLDVKFFPGLKVNLKGLKVVPKSGNGLELNGFGANVALLPALTGKIVVKSLSLEEPSLEFVKTASGVRLSGFPEKKNSTGTKASLTSSETQPKKQQNKKNAAKSPLPDFLKFNLEDFSITNARIHYRDENTNTTVTIPDLSVQSALQLGDNIVRLPESTITLTAPGNNKIKVKGDNISYDLKSGLIQIERLAPEFSDTVLDFSGALKTLEQKGSFRIREANIYLQDLISLATQFVPALAPLKFSGLIQPDMRVSTDQNKLSKASGKIALSKIGGTFQKFELNGFEGLAQLKSSPGEIKVEVEELTGSVNGETLSIPQTISLRDQTIYFNEILEGFGGSGSAIGSIGMGAADPLTVELSASNMQIQSMLKALASPAQNLISGTLNSFNTKVSGIKGENLISSLSGTSSLDFQNGSLLGVNLAGLVLKSVDGIPFLSGALIQLVPPKFQGLVQSKDTKIEKLTGNFQIGNTSLQTSDLEMLSDLFLLKAKGTVGFNMNLNLDATMLFNPEFSKSMVEKNEKLAEMLDSEERLVVPLSLKGTPPKILVYPDMKELMKLGVGRKIEKEAGRLIEKAFGGEKGSGEGAAKDIGKMFGF